jgi:alpha-beta hydrolase superfamily lysophospholipase
VTVGYREGSGIGALGTALAWRLWEAEVQRASLLLVHGLGEHSGRYDHFARVLATHGTTVFAFDLRGHGLSPGPRGDVDAFPRFLEDLLGMEEEMAREVPDVGPRFLMGHSLGGLICIRRLQVSRGLFHGALMSAPWMATAMPSVVRRLGRILGIALPGMLLPAGLSEDRLTRDPKMAEAIRQDPLIHRRITARLFRSTEREQQRALASPWPKGLAALFLVPERDRVVQSRVTIGFVRGIVGDHVRLEILKGREHEPLNDIGREEVFRTVLDWLADRMPEVV